MAVLDTLLEVEKSLLGVAGSAANTATEAVGDVVKTAAEMVRDVIDTLGGVVKD